MEIGTCEVRLGGNIKNSVPMINVTPAQVLVLRAVHGTSDCVVKINKVADVNLDDKSEKARLQSIYNPQVVESLFNGYNPVLPQKFEDVEVKYEEVESFTNEAQIPDLDKMVKAAEPKVETIEATPKKAAKKKVVALPEED